MENTEEAKHGLTCFGSKEFYFLDNVQLFTKDFIDIFEKMTFTRNKLTDTYSLQFDNI